MKEKILSKKVAIIAGLSIAVLLFLVAIVIYNNRDGEKGSGDKDTFSEQQQNDESDEKDENKQDVEIFEDDDETADEQKGSNENSAETEDNGNSDIKDDSSTGTTEEEEDIEEPVMEPDTPDQDKWTAYY